MAYTLTLRQFEEFVAPYLTKINDEFMSTQQEQLVFNINTHHPYSAKVSCFTIGYGLIGEFAIGRLYVKIKSGFELSIEIRGGHCFSTENLQEDMQEGLWRYCYNLFGEEYKTNLIIYMLSEREKNIGELENYIKGVENADVIDMYVAENEIKAAQDEIAYLQQYYDNALEVIETLGDTVTCN